MILSNRSLLLIALLTLASMPLQAAEVQDQINWPEFMARHDMTWQRLPASWKEAPHFGNAMVGSMLYRTPNALTLQLFRADVQDHRDNSHGWTAYSRPRLMIGSFQLKPVGKLLGCNWRLDLYNAQLTGTIQTDRGEIRIRHFVHADDMIILTELWTTPGESPCQWSWQPCKAQTTRPGYPTTPQEIEAFAKRYGDIFRDNLKLNQPNPDGRQESDRDVNVWVQDLLAGGQYATAWVDSQLEPNHRLHIVSIANSYPEKSARDQAIQSVSSFRARKLQDSEASHRNWWHRYYAQSFVSLPDRRLESLYWQTIYRYGCTARTGRSFIDTSGLWFQGGGWCYATTDYNIQTAHWSLYAANRLEQSGEILETLHRNRQTLIDNVRPVEWQSDSAFLGIAAAAADMIAPRDQDMRYWNLVGCLPWTLHNCWWQYRYSMDDAMLRDKLFPLLRRSINLYLHMLQEDAGRLRLPPTYSPESGTFKDANFDLALLRWGCQTLLSSARRLKIDDPLIPRWKDVLNRLPDFPADEHGFRLGADSSSAPNHRHGSHLLMIYPLHLVNIDQPDTLQLLRLSANRFNATPGLPAMVATHGVPIAAAIGDGNLALKGLQRQQADLFPNGLWYNTPCIESSLSVANGIQSTLLQSWGDTLRVFPAVPDAWQNLVFHNLRAEGAFLVSASRKQGRTQWIRIHSLAGEPCRVKTDLPEPINAQGCQLRKISDGLYELPLQAGQDAILYSGPTAPDPTVAAEK